ncbi:MAG: putative ABC transporter permease [Oscillospiraceae bacterium]|nr:putative ABC transporter permease [Oscillospiraceae bacterium]
MIKERIKIPILFLAGGAIYGLVEILARGWTHISMFIVGGICFILIGGMNQYIKRDIPIAAQMLISAGIITLLELITGVIVNLWLGLEVWDYSHQNFNFLGQICLHATSLWVFLSLAGIVIDDFARCRMFGEERVSYRLLP